MSVSQQTHEAVLINQETGQTFPLDQETTTLGRKADNTIVLADDAAISRRHALITHQDGSYLIQDAGSANGTYLNDQRIAEPQPLSNGDVVRLGQTRLTIQFPEKPEEEALVTPSEPNISVATSVPPSARAEIPEPALPPIHRQLFLIQESIDLKGNYNIFDPESGHLLFKGMQSRDLVQSLLKTGGNRFDCWLRTPEDRPLLRISKGLAMLTAKPVQVRDERDQLMGELRPMGKSKQHLFEVFDSIHELLFNVERTPDGFRLMTSGLQCASIHPAPPGAFPKVHGDTTVLEVSTAVPTNLFIRQMILATAVAVLLVTSSS